MKTKEDKQQKKNLNVSDHCQLVLQEVFSMNRPLLCSDAGVSKTFGISWGQWNWALLWTLSQEFHSLFLHSTSLGFLAYFTYSVPFCLISWILEWNFCYVRFSNEVFGFGCLVSSFRFYLVSWVWAELECFCNVTKKVWEF